MWAFRGCRHSGVSQPESSRRCAGDRQNVVGDGIFFAGRETRGCEFVLQWERDEERNVGGGRELL